MSELVHAGNRRVAWRRELVATGAVLLAIGLERLANSYLLGDGSALVSVAAGRFLIGLALSAVGSIFVIAGLGRARVEPAERHCLAMSSEARFPHLSRTDRKSLWRQRRRDGR